MAELVLFWVIFAVLVAWWASRVGVGWWVGFVLALMLSPLLGALIVAIMATPRRGAAPSQADRIAAAGLAIAEREAAAARPPAPNRRTGRVEPTVHAVEAPPALSAERMAEIEAEERYRAEVRARLAAERGEGG